MVVVVVVVMDPFRQLLGLQQGAEDGWQCHRNGTGRVMKTEGQEGCDGPL